MSVLNNYVDKEVIEEVATLLSLRSTFVEKDYYVTYLLKIITNFFHEDFSLIFSGGTALSKAHKLIERFSEDVDFKVNYIKETLSRKELSEFKVSLKNYLETNGFIITDEKASIGNKHFYFELEYPSVYTKDENLRPYILLEINLKKPNLLPVCRAVSSLINEISPNALPEVENIYCVNPMETAAEKLSAITWRVFNRIRDDEKYNPIIVRHIYDLAILSNYLIKENSNDFLLLVKSAIQTDINRSKTHEYKNLTIKEKFNTIISQLENDIWYEKEYNKFINNFCYTVKGNPLYKNALEQLKKIINYI